MRMGPIHNAEHISDNLQLLKEASSQTTANIVIEPLAGRHLLQQLAVQYRPVICSKPSSSISTHQLTPTIEQVKSLNIIVITYGVPSDDVESVIVRAAKRLDQCNAEPWQVGIQFFQVGEEPKAAEDLRDLDDGLASQEGVHDMIDTVSWSGEQGEGLNANGIFKVVLGAVNRRLDRKPGR